MRYHPPAKVEKKGSPLPKILITAAAISALWFGCQRVRGQPQPTPPPTQAVVQQVATDIPAPAPTITYTPQPTSIPTYTPTPIPTSAPTSTSTPVALPQPTQEQISYETRTDSRSYCGPATVHGPWDPKYNNWRGYDIRFTTNNSIFHINLWWPGKNVFNGGEVSFILGPDKIFDADGAGGIAWEFDASCGYDFVQRDMEAHIQRRRVQAQQEGFTVYGVVTVDDVISRGLGQYVGYQQTSQLIEYQPERQLKWPTTKEEAVAMFNIPFHRTRFIEYNGVNFFPGFDDGKPAVAYAKVPEGAMVEAFYDHGLPEYQYKECFVALGPWEGWIQGGTFWPANNEDDARWTLGKMTSFPDKPCVAYGFSQ